jgi:predicted RNA-binding protein with PUA-like domain
MEKQYWLMKTEPETFSFAQLKREKTTVWEGVRNFQARNFIRSMKKDDLVLIYHSNCKDKGVVGLGQVTKTAYPDPSAQNPRSLYFDARSATHPDIWSVVDVTWYQDLLRLVSLEEIKNTVELQDMRLVRKGNRLSILPVEEAEFKLIVKKGMEPTYNF